MSNKKELTLVNLEILGSSIFIGTIIISILISYNNKLKLENKIPLFDDKTVREILIINKTVVLIVVILFLCLNYESLKFAEENNRDTSTLKIQLIPSFLALVSSLIILYLVLKKGNNNISRNENPEF